MSQDNENKPDDLDFTEYFEDQNNNAETPLTDSAEENFHFDEDINFEDSGFPNVAPLEPVTTESATSGAETAESETFSFTEQPPFPDFTDTSSSPTGENPAKSDSTGETSTEIPETIAAESKGRKSQKEEKESKVKPKKENLNQNPMDLSSKLSLILGTVLLLCLIIVNIVSIFFTSYKEWGISFAGVVWYLISIDIIGGAGIVAVPILFYRYRKDVDLFKILLGLSVMALTFGVLLLLTELSSYDFIVKKPTPTPSIPAPLNLN